MRTAYAALAAVLLLAIAVSATFAVECGDLGTVDYLSGCTACTAVNVTFAGRNKTRSGKPFAASASGEQTSTPLRKNHGHSWGASGSKLLPNCTECDASRFFKLKTWAADSSSSRRPYTGRCGCISGYGAKPAGNVTVTWGNKNKTMPTFECVQCGDSQVTLGHGSGVVPVYDKAADEWSLVLKTAKATEDGTGDAAKRSTDGSRKSGPAGSKGRKDKGFGKGFGRGSFGPYFPGQCIDCPANSNKEGAACVAA
ncbi:hypothetical protein COO60DRAFT_1491123 [Scenedesmus sp. NREL 46B-D3]|nr:hypothetical protein COO60DRAFT_1491123 [Scenedesmus sp. NREL 46B-D3]